MEQLPLETRAAPSGSLQPLRAPLRASFLKNLSQEPGVANLI